MPDRPRIPTTDAARLRALRQFEVVDSEPEMEFDEIADLAADVCEAPIALISLVETDRQFFKAERGLGMRSTPISQSICVYAFDIGDFLEVPDTLADPRFCDNTLCLDVPNVRFYAGAVLRTDEGVPLGTLCVLDTRPRTLSDHQRKTLRVLANQVLAQLKLRRALKRQAVLQHEIDHRVKNSLQAVASFVRLQSAQLTNDDAQSALAAVGRRIAAVALLHEELYRSHSVGEVRMDEFMGRVGHLFSDTAPDGIAIATLFDPVRMRSQDATAVAAIANEFVTNSIKHAFPDGRTGRIAISGRVVGDSALVIDLADDGVGKAGDPPPTTANGHGAPNGSARDGLGDRIIAAAVVQLGATLTVNATTSGYAITIEVPVDAAQIVTEPERPVAPPHSAIAG